MIFSHAGSVDMTHPRKAVVLLGYKNSQKNMPAWLCKQHHSSQAKVKPLVHQAPLPKEPNAVQFFMRIMQ